jgi:pimeloyl-ACP methyl ester carboxylesterase
MLDCGLHVLLIDAGGHGRSDDIEVSSMPAFAEDVQLGVDWLRARPEVDPARLVLVGHSVGAGACLLVASRDPSLAAVICLASLAHPRVLMSRMLRKRLPAPAVSVALRIVEHAIGHRFETFAPVNSIKRVRAPVLLLHGECDATVPVADAVELYGRAPPGSQLVVVPGADHTSIDAIEYVGPAVQAFLSGIGVVSTVG